MPKFFGFAGKITAIAREAEKLKIAGIVAEFNPFHNGHAHLIKKAREAGFTHIAICLSSDVVQRGDIALFDRHTRARLAAENGVDLVLELPVPFCSSCAEVFAKASVSILKSVGIDALVFGSEIQSATALKNAADASSALGNSDCVKELLLSGESYPKALETAASKLFDSETAEVFKNPNATLGLEYIKALGDTPFTAIGRTCPHTGDETCDKFTSAENVRRILFENGDVSPYVPYDPSGIRPSDISRIERALIFEIVKCSKSDLLNVPDINEDLANRIKASAATAKTYRELISAVKTKAYTMARIKRCLVNFFLGVTQSDLALAPYIRPLAANDKGIEILSNANVKFSPSLKDLEADHPRLCELSERAARLFDLATENPECKSEYRRPLIRIQENLNEL